MFFLNVWLYINVLINVIEQEQLFEHMWSGFYRNDFLSLWYSTVL